MSDPGSTYRTRDEISSMRQQRDPVEHVRKLLTDNNFMEPSEMKKLEKVCTCRPAPHTPHKTPISIATGKSKRKFIHNQTFCNLLNSASPGDALLPCLRCLGQQEACSICSYLSLPPPPPPQFLSLIMASSCLVAVNFRPNIYFVCGGEKETNCIRLHA
jgi:hypothetical protein